MPPSKDIGRSKKSYRRYILNTLRYGKENRGARLKTCLHCKSDQFNFSETTSDVGFGNRQN